MHHRRWQYTHGMRIGRNEDMVAHYNRQAVPDCLVKRSARSNQYTFVGRHGIDQALNTNLDVIGRQIGPVSVPPQLDYNIKYHLAEFLSHVIGVNSLSPATPVVDYQDLRTRFLALLGHGGDEDTLVQLMQVACDGGMYQPPSSRQASLPQNKSLAALRAGSAAASASGKRFRSHAAHAAPSRGAARGAREPEPYCRLCDTGEHVREVAMPYATKVFLQEVMAMNVAPRLRLEQ